jgi:hypothetical protein
VRWFQLLWPNFLQFWFRDKLGHRSAFYIIKASAHNRKTFAGQILHRRRKIELASNSSVAALDFSRVKATPAIKSSTMATAMPIQRDRINETTAPAPQCSSRNAQAFGWW